MSTKKRNKIKTINKTSIFKIAVHNCFCDKIKKGERYDTSKCDLGCMYPGS